MKLKSAFINKKRGNLLRKANKKCTFLEIKKVHFLFMITYKLLICNFLLGCLLLLHLLLLSCNIWQIAWICKVLKGMLTIADS